MKGSVFSRAILLIHLMALFFVSNSAVADVSSVNPIYEVWGSSAESVGLPSGPCYGDSEEAVWNCMSSGMGNSASYVSDLRLTSSVVGAPVSGFTFSFTDTRDFELKTAYMYLTVNTGCPAGYTGLGQGCIPIKEIAADVCTGNPISALSGNKMEFETDYDAGGPFPVVFGRYYHSKEPSISSIYSELSIQNSGLSIPESIGANWDHSYSSRLVPGSLSGFQYEWAMTDDTTNSFGSVLQQQYDTNPDSLAVMTTLYRPNGTAYKFKNIYNPYTKCFDSSQWGKRTASVIGKLESTDACDSASYFKYTTPDNNIEVYDDTGKLLSITSASGITHTINYTDEKVATVQHSTGETLTFLYDASNRVSMVSDTNSRTWTYRYDASGNLQYVDNPDTTTRQYHYENIYNLNALTGISDERGVRYSHFDYDGSGRAIASYHGPVTSVLADRIDGVFIDFDTNYGTSNTLANSNGGYTDYNFGDIGSQGFKLLTSITGPGCAECGTTGITNNYDPITLDITSVNENGLVTGFGSYDSLGFPTTVTEAEGSAEARTRSVTYDSRYVKKPAIITEPSMYATGNKVTTIGYDDFGNTTSVSVAGYKPDGTAVSRSQSFVYGGPFHQLTEINGPRTDVDDRTLIDYYIDDVSQGNNRARMKKVTAPLGIVTYDNITYTATGKTAAYTTGNDLQVSFVYYAGNDRLEKITQKDLTTLEERVTLWTYLATGEVETVTTGDGSTDATTITLEYDVARRLTRIYDGADTAASNYIKYTLDTEGNVIDEEIRDANSALKKALNQSFDAYNRSNISKQDNISQTERRDVDFSPDGTLDLEKDGNNVITNYSYDALRRLTQIKQDEGGVDPTTQNAITKFDYDVQDNLTYVKDPVNGEITYVYDDLGNLLSQTSPDTGITEFTHDEAGNIQTSFDAKDQLIYYSYDALNRPALIDASGTEDDVTYVYDTCANGKGLLCTVQAASVTTHYIYDAFGQVRSHQAIAYAYDAANSLQSMGYPSGAEVGYNYNAAGQVEAVSLTRNGNTVSLASLISYSPFGPLTSLTYGNTSILNQQFDTAYRMNSQQVTGIFENSYSQYDANGNLVQRDDILLPSSDVFAYDALDRLDTVTGTLNRNYDYDKNGNRTRLDADGAITNYTYDALNFKPNRLDQQGSDDVDLDANGNTETKGNSSYTYTSRNRLFEVFDSGVLKATYTYNALGQRIRKTLPDSSGRYYLYGIDGALLAETDINGNVLSEYVYLNGELLAMYHPDSDADGSTNVQEDVLGTNPVNVDSDGDGLLDNDERFVHGTSAQLADTEDDGISDALEIALNSSPLDASMTLGDINLNNSIDLGDYVLLVQYVLGTRTPTPTEQEQADLNKDGQLNTQDMLKMQRALLGAGTSSLDQLLAYVPVLLASLWDELIPNAYAATGDGEIFYVHNDHLGTPKAMSDEFGTRVWRATHDAFGQAAVDVMSSVELNVRFSGQYYDAESGLHYNYFRYYDPSNGRYLTSDPIGLAGGLNTFGYVGGNPVNWTDSLGLLVTVSSRPVAGSGGAGSHTITTVTQSNGTTTVISSHSTNGQNVVSLNHPSDTGSNVNITDSVTIPIPKGMTEAGFDQAVLDQAQKMMQSPVEPYRPFPGIPDVGNCHTTTTDLINGAGGSMPNSFNPQGLNPGLN